MRPHDRVVNAAMQIDKAKQTDKAIRKQKITIFPEI